jgi:type IV pilus assembly protein PilA
MRAQKGFSLIELLVVVAIILILAAIAIPNYLDSKMRSNEASAVGSLRQIGTAQNTYILTYPEVGYSTTLGNLGPGNPASSSAAGLLDDVLGCAGTTCNKSGYTFGLSTGAGYYSVVGTPTTVNSTGRRGFLNDSSGIIRYNATGGAPSLTDPPIQ